MTVHIQPGSREASGLLDLVATRIHQSKRILVVTGAGVSCNAGIPDFRSKNGLYNMVKQQYPTAVLKGRDLFDVILFRSEQSTRIFFSVMSTLRARMLNAQVTPTHKFIRHLKDSKRLLRCYTQNIDGLESKVGLIADDSISKGRSAFDVVQLHGDIHKLKCVRCQTRYDWTDNYHNILAEGMGPPCPSCSIEADERESLGKRAIGVGLLRPDIILYGEDHPSAEYIGKCASMDIKSRPDCLIIAGTSLKVTGIKRLVNEAARGVHANGGIVIFINQGEVPSSTWSKIIDYHVVDDCDSWVEDFKHRRPMFFKLQAELPAYKLKKRNTLQSNKKSRAGAVRKSSSSAKFPSQQMTATIIQSSTTLNAPGS